MNSQKRIWYVFVDHTLAWKLLNYSMASFTQIYDNFSLHFRARRLKPARLGHLKNFQKLQVSYYNL